MEANAHLLAAVAALPGPPQVEVVRSLADLGPRLQQPRHQGLLCLAVLPSPAHLAQLMSLEPLLRDIPLVVLLPDEDPATLAQAHRLRARYLTSLQRPEAPQMAAAVAARMMEKYDRPWECQGNC